VTAPLDWLRAADPGRVALLGVEGALTYGALVDAVGDAARVLEARGARVLASRLDNGPTWAVLDLACWHAGVVHVPLPAFFSDEQVAHVLAAAGVDTLAAPGSAGGPDTLAIAGTVLALRRLPNMPVPIHRGTAKISFTSGSTGRPKGACLSGESLAAVAGGVAAALAPLGIARHLSALPLPVLLENVAGLYAPLAAGATCVLAPLASVGLSGSSGFDAGVLQRAVERWLPDTAIVLPQMLRAWAAHRGARQAAPGAVPVLAPRFVAVGGAAVGAPTLLAARSTGLPAYEGYGLTEGGSVQTLNLPGADLPGSAGRALPHARVRVSAAGEIEIAGSPMLGYLGEAPRPAGEWWPTGDLGRLDDAGFVHLTGRLRNLLVTAFGRNVSPEWVETALQSQPAIGVAVVFGDGMPALSVVIWPSRSGLSRDAIDGAVRAANATLPDYARIHRWVAAALPFDTASGMATANGRPQREAIERHHSAALAAPHEEGIHDALP
jgi:long-subunit acyl-CoA synthetase (AMP-forming)